MLRLILGRAGTGKTGQIMHALQELTERKIPGNLLIVPEQYSHEAERELASVCGDSMSLYTEVQSFSRLAYSISQELGGSARVYVDAGGRLLQLALALRQVSGRLMVYSDALRQPQIMEQLLSALDELRFGRASSETLGEAAGQVNGQLASKLRDLALLREALDAMEMQTGADPASALDRLIERIPESRKLCGAHIFIDGFTDFTAQEREIVRRLNRTAEEVTVCLSCDGLEDDSEVFALARRTARLLRQDAEEDGVPVELNIAPSWKKGTALGFLEENLFGWSTESFESQGTIRLFTAESVSAECEAAAASIRKLVSETGCRWRDVAIAVRGFEEYRSVLETAFRRYDLPLYVSAKTDVFSRPLPALIDSAFEAIADGWSADSMFSYLKTGLTGITREESDLLENYVLLWSLRRSAWVREEPWKQHPDGYNGKMSGEASERLEKIDELRRRIAAPLAALEARGKEAKTAFEQCEALAAFWDELYLPSRLDRRSEELESIGEEQTAAEYRQLWERIVSALEQCAAVLGDMPMEQDTFAALFRRVLSQYDIGTIPISLDRVTAGDFDRMRRRRIRHLFVLGATDDRLPSIPGGGSIFTDTERETLRALSLELAGADDHLNREFNLIYNVLTLPSETLTVSRPRISPEGSETRISFLAERIKNLFSLSEETISMSETRTWANGPALELACAGDPTARGYFLRKGEDERLERLDSAAHFVRGQLGRQAVRSLYGEKIRLTASRVDLFASCRFRYFLQYGLKAKPRIAAGFNPPEQGTFLHYLLENTAKEARERGGFQKLTHEEIGEITDRYVEKYVCEELDGFREKTPRFVYLFRRLSEKARRIVLDTADELCRSDFQPLDFELDFEKTKDLPPVYIGRGEDSLLLTGVADRVDGWEHDGKLYIRVVDYKSGKKAFSFSDVWYGMGLQMLLYLFALERNGETHYNQKVIPAGVLYVPAKDVLLSASERLTDEEILAEKAKKLRRSGLLLSDDGVLNAMEHGEEIRYLPIRLNRENQYVGDALATAEQLSELSRHIDRVLTDMARDLRCGSIRADPWYRSEQENTCLSCDYFSACHFDEKNDGWRYKSALKAPEFWEKLAKREKGDENHATD